MTLRINGADKAPVPQPELYVGEELEIAVTAEVLIDRDKTWIKFTGRGTVQPGETGSAAYERVQAFCAQKFAETVNRTVSQIQELGS
jgi:hypothetical protein